MTQNIETRAAVAVNKFEKASESAFEFAGSSSDEFKKPDGSKSLSLTGISNRAENQHQHQQKTFDNQYQVNQSSFETQKNVNQQAFESQKAANQTQLNTQLTEFSAQFNAQYTYQRIGVWPANADLTKAEHQNCSFEYPEGSGQWYAPVFEKLPFNTGSEFNSSQFVLVSAADQSYTQMAANKSARLATTEVIAPINSLGDAGVGTVIPAGVGKVVHAGKLHSVYPVALTDRVVSYFLDDRVYFENGTFAYISEDKKDKKITFNKSNTVEKDVTVTANIIEAMIEFDEVVIDGVEIWLAESIVPNAAKVRKITVKNGGVIRLDDLSLVIEVEGKSFVIDLRDGGKIHGGLRKALVARDHTPGETVIDVVNADDLRVGDHLATSMMGDDGDGNKWTNAARNPGDAYNTITAINGNQVTVTNPVGQRCLVKNTWLGNALFGRGGITFKGADRSFVATVLGGHIEETGAGYYISATTNTGEFVDPAYLFVRGTKFTGQFLDGFLLRGEIVHASFDDDWDVHQTYDIAKQSFIQDTGGDIELRNGKLRRGNYDVEFYPTGRKLNLGRIKMYNVECDGQSTLSVKPDQINSITGLPLSDTWANLGDSLHVTQWSIDSGRLNVGGFEARKCKFHNYRRGVVGTTYEGISQDLNILGDIKISDSSMDCPPHFIKVNGHNLYMSGEWQYSNLTINAKYSDPYYLLGYCGAAVEDAPKPVYSGVTTLITTPETQYPNSCRVGTMQTLHCIGNSGGTSVNVRLVEPYDVDKVIAENVNVFKLTAGQSNYLTQTVLMGMHAQFTGQPWRDSVQPVWFNNGDAMNTDSGYVGVIQRKLYRKAEEVSTWMRVCKLTSINAPVATCELCIKPAKAYGGSGFIDGKFLLSLKPDNSIVSAEVVEQSSGLYGIANNEVKAVAVGLVGVSNMGLTDISEIQFRLTDSNVLEIKIGGTTDLGMLVAVNGNVVDF